MFIISHNVRIFAFVTFVGFVHSIGTKSKCSIFIYERTGDHKRLLAIPEHSINRRPQKAVP